ncbi:hypothetical protein BRDID11004_47850 [Bradyrhizobium diazoefficiens]|uniref:Uncharacterized protein n=1 Tax=Bradyrhizobium diazoefficiens TaxID=1355477 RepID=A0A809ZZ03_9BRAD|nr:hypothetical protein [Bradyrhizobium diazoefficiens]BBZ94312.1 hypothetical protein F07S3_41450 [Bradyrhizobium diazoefficiens]BCE56400.1 hypothetical protein XF5B_39120 [Bradyrhizobium diazoefficiens]
MTAAFTPISHIAYGRRRRQAVLARALVVHHETAHAFLCSSDGIKPTRVGDGWLPKKALEVLDTSKAPFILVIAPSSLLTTKRLFGFEPATLKGDWTEEQQAAWRAISAAASRERLKGTKPQRNRCENGNEYA